VKLGLLGGTFDPVHLGHLRAAETAREALALERVLFLAARQPPHRSGVVSSPLDRYAMVCLATAGSPAFVPSDLELRREGPSYTVDTLRALAGEHPGDELVLIVGSDTFPEMPGWHDPEGILALCQVAVIDRPGSASAPAPGWDRVRRLEGPELPISSTLVRRLAGSGRSVRHLVPDAVADYISKRGLYR
jgi:nicotinate-nucleotide adenylyltransferase